ncbi:hypothetical protein CC85DRAFT_298590 [Cutaneotrichosporon oleaginosum]|uniref:Uncharacterized protein n=1 Tax=Cutaneotrichosporon oleaginosum TaxID=879819 RepID=A0A0J0XZC9_9TREE|nr:uncharacterized protein CC85DRAFT_298590 [Cutaneotrichosporon oleaginosum]KLT46387.1 hypothetical protein CC85DRAFT_298590 [Cutaneotrichosporon oleaginosum]TXT15243.1 hypothetical protein COLE_01436 [Cutaneotrichosporon oleaginosum]
MAAMEHLSKAPPLNYNDDGHDSPREETTKNNMERRRYPLPSSQRYGTRTRPETPDPTLVSDEPPSSYNPYIPSERFRLMFEVDDSTETYGDLRVRPDTRIIGRAGPQTSEVPFIDANSDYQPLGKDKNKGRKGKDKTVGLRMRKSWEKLRESVGLEEKPKYPREAWPQEQNDGGSPPDQRPEPLSRPFDEKKAAKLAKGERKGSISSLFSLGGRSTSGRSLKERRGIPPMEPLHIPENRHERLAMGPTLTHTPREWKINDGDITRLRAASPHAESLRLNVVDERVRRGESPAKSTVHRLVRRASGPLRRTFSKMSLRSKKSTENVDANEGEDFFLPAPNALHAPRPDRHACYLDCKSCLREDVHKFTVCFCDCDGCRRCRNARQ